ncbi:VPS4-associated protein 1 [Talaromyces proteolyticus]|uniref:VPS4-associated protein 1 n=1 Tax=Talaromyces proteolyticus TaxID=1131652 RepID=A0AAD4Q0I4_9EURO|nr:VPS4-associated protein 1 [Talaromyces proteolyticus]KAH8697218.1 VPS4-associated protein 1 [Talaromyces proteolyticus]
MSLQNVWHLRRVADTASKACYICYKPSTSVLITPDNKKPKDFFYVCPSHLKDRGFCSPIIDAEEDAKKKKDEELAREIEQVKQEYEEKQKRKKEKKKEKKEKKEEEDEDKESKKSEKEDDRKAEQEKNNKIEELQKKAEHKADDFPRIFTLHKNFYQMRINRIRSIDLAKRNAERMKDPALFPSVPKGDI